MSKMDTLVIFIQTQQAICFRYALRVWEVMPIQGEQWIILSTTEDIASLLKNISDRINKVSKLAEVEIHLLYQAEAVNLLSSTPKAFHDLDCKQWQILRLEPILQRAGALDGADNYLKDINFLQKHVLPVLASTFGYRDETAETERAQAVQVHEDTMESLRAEILRMNQEKAALQARISALQLPEIEQLLVFLPAIFRNFWGKVRPDELALLAGTLKVPSITSPYLDPSADTVAILKRRLLNLPEQDLNKIIRFCRELQPGLEVRTEMREVIGDLT